MNTRLLLVTIAFHTMYQVFPVFLLNNHTCHSAFEKRLVFCGFVPYLLTQNLYPFPRLMFRILTKSCLQF